MLSLAHAQHIIDHAIALADELNRSISVSLVDTRGHEIAGARMDGASWFTLGVARAKAETASMFRRPSHGLEQLWNDHPRLVPLIEHQLAFHPTTLSGGVPIFEKNEGESILGAVGVAGALPELDLQIAETLAQFAAERLSR